MVAWSAYKSTDNYANSKKWAKYELHVDGSLWAAFSEGFAKGSVAAAGCNTETLTDKDSIIELMAREIEAGFKSCGSYGPNPVYDMALHAAMIVYSHIAAIRDCAEQAEAEQDRLRKALWDLLRAIEKGDYRDRANMRLGDAIPAYERAREALKASL
jgi:hypothetical protein